MSVENLSFYFLVTYELDGCLYYSYFLIDYFL